MAGHSKWSNIQYRKKKQDAKRSRLFTALIKQIKSAAHHNPDPATNTHLAQALAKAGAANVSQDTINRALKRTKDVKQGLLNAVRYEGYGPNGIAVLVEAFTDNNNRTAGEVRHIFSKNGGNLGVEGSVSWLFHQKGLITLSDSNYTEEQLTELALLGEVEDIIFSPSYAFNAKLITKSAYLNQAVDLLEQHHIIIEEHEVTWIPVNRTLLKDEILLEKLSNLIIQLEALEDVHSVSSVHSFQLH